MDGLGTQEKKKKKKKNHYPSFYRPNALPLGQISSFKLASCGGPVDGSENGSLPLPWVVLCELDHLFRDETKKIEIPKTSVALKAVSYTHLTLPTMPDV